MDEFWLSYLELDLIGQVLATDVRPQPFSFPHHGESWGERLALAGEAEESLAARNLADEEQIAPKVESAVGIYAQGEPYVTVQGVGPRGELVARAALRGNEASCAVEDGDGLLFALMEGRGVVPWLLSLLPTYHPGTGRSATVRAASASGAQGPDERRPEQEDFSRFSYLNGPGETAGHHERDRQVVDEIMSRRRLGSGCFTVSTWNRRGGAGMRLMLDWIDTDVGRYVCYSTFGHDGAESRVYLPADSRFLGRKLDELIRTCLDAAR